MLQIYLHNGFNSGWLDIPDNGQLSLETLWPNFDENYNIATFSLPLDLSLTPKNRRIMDYQERLKNTSDYTTEFICDVFDDFWPEFINAKLTITGKKPSLDYNNGSISISISGTQTLFGTLIKDKTFKNFKLGGEINWSKEDLSCRDFATALMKGGQYLDYAERICFSPLVIESFFNTDDKNYTDEFLARDTVNDIGINGNTWQFGRVTDTAGTAIADTTNAAYKDYRTVPFFFLKYILNTIAEELGYKITGDWINESKWNKMVIFNNYGLEQYTGTIDKCRNIIPSNHLPDIKVKDFLVAFFSAFNLYPTFPDLKTIELKYRNNDFSQKTICSLNGKVESIFESSIETDSAKGYKIGWSQDSDDQLWSDLVQDDLSQKNFVGSVTSYDDLAGFTIPDTITVNTNVIVFVANENTYYQVADATSSPITWEVCSERLNNYVKVSGKTYVPTDTLPDDTGNSIEFGCSTLANYVETDVDTSLKTRRAKLATSQNGSYIAKGGSLVSHSFNLRLFYADFQSINGVNVPTSFNRLADGTVQSLAPLDGFAEDYHTQWQDFKLNPETIKVKVIANKRVNQDIQNANIIELNGVQFLPYQSNYTIPITGSYELQLKALQ